MLELEYGVVKFFDNRDNKLFGFLTVLDEDDQPTGEEIFFHFYDGSFVGIVDGDIQFIGRVGPGTEVPMWHPRVGEKLAFDRSTGTGSGNRPKAYPWTYAEAYDNRVRKLTAPYYRVLQVTRNVDGPGVLIWVGQGADDLSAEYPIRVLGDKLDDPLAEGIVTRYRFEMRVTTDPESWVECSDPRYCPDAARELMGA